MSLQEIEKQIEALSPAEVEELTQRLVARRTEDAQTPETGDAFDWLREHAGALEMPEDWAEEHDHYIHNSPKRASRASEG